MQKHLRNVGARLIALPARLLFRLIKLLTLSLLGAGVAVTIIVVRHLLNTPQRLDSILPGEARIYRWKHGHISYNVLGAENAPPLVLLHNLGIYASSYEMRTIVEPLAKYYRIYAPDLLGFGLSDRPSLNYSAETYISLCRDFLTEVIQQPARAGISLEGTTRAPTLLASGLACNYAVAVAQTVPTLCERLVLISPIALLTGGAQKAPVEAGLPTLSSGQRPALIPSWFAPALGDTRLQKLLEIPFIQSLLFAILVRATLAATQRSHSVEALSGVYGARFNTFAPLAPTQRDINYLYATTHRFGAEHAPIALLAGKLIPDVSKQLEAVQQPTLIIWGANTLNTARVLKKNNADGLPPNTQLALIPDAGLYVHEERPEIVVSTIREWSTEGQATENL